MVVATTKRGNLRWQPWWALLAAVQQRVTSEFKIAHATVQVECKGCAAYETHL